jgi:hypothetical protein
MRIIKRLSSKRAVFGLVLTLLWGSYVLPNGAQAQSPGNNAVYSPSATCCSASSSFIDASVSATSQGTDLCATIYNIFAGTHGNPTYPSAGAVIDARGISGSALTCGSNESPWLSGGTFQAKASVILLPSGTINVSYTWILPNNTKIVGEGASNTGSTGTVIAAASNFTGPGVSGYPLSMIQFGDSTATGANCGPCFRISIEDVTLNASLVTSVHVSGILNLDSQELTYAKRISLLGISGIGLENGDSTSASGPQNAGPYEQIYYSSHTGTCAQIYGAGMRGIHGITCVGNTTNPISGGGILLDSTDNSIEDVFVDGYTDGILVGSQPSTSSRAWGNVFFNINGGSTLTNVVHLCGSTGTSPCPTTSGTAVQDASFIGVTSGNSSGTSIKDEASGATLADSHVGIYALGDPFSVGYSRFTTSRTVPSWFTGSPVAATGSACGAATGSIYTATTTAVGTGTAWACVGGQWHLVH